MAQRCADVDGYIAGDRLECSAYLLAHFHATPILNAQLYRLLEACIDPRPGKFLRRSLKRSDPI